MRKYLVIDQKKYGDEYIDVHDTLEDANTDAEYQWDHLTRNEKKEHHIFVAHVEDSDDYLNDWAFEDDEVDWTAYHSLDTEERYFDSDKESE